MAFYFSVQEVRTVCQTNKWKNSYNIWGEGSKVLTTRAYLTFRDIQECLTEYYRQNGSRIGFAEAVRILHNKRKTTETIRSIPDFRVWDLTNRGQLWDLYQDTPIDVSYIIEHPDAFHTLMPEHDSYFELGDSSIMIVLRDEAIKKLQRLSFFKIIYVLQGKCDLTLENDKRILETGDAVILPPGILHDHRPLGDDNITIHISIKKSTFRTAFQQMLSDDTVLSSFFMRCFYEDNSSFLLFHLEPTEYSGLRKQAFRHSEQPFRAMSLLQHSA